jgi:hypothetical protein
MKSLHTIVIKQTRVYRSVRVESDAEDMFLPLADKVEEYVRRLGYSSAHTLGVVVQLLTVGKIRLDFKDYTERLQIKHPQDLMKRVEAINLVEHHLAQFDPPTELIPDDGFTQKIIIQPPRQ